MYISNDGTTNLNIDELNATTPDEIRWSRGFQNEDVLKVKFDLHSKIDSFEIQSSIKKLKSEIEQKTKFTLTGIKYNIKENSGEFVFSQLGNIEPDKKIGKLLSNNPDSIKIPKTIAVDDTVVCTGSFITFFDWGYTVDSILFVKEDGMYIKAIKED